MQQYAVNKYLHAVASGWIFINIEPLTVFFYNNIFLRKVIKCTVSFLRGRI